MFEERSILIAEDEVIIALELEDAIRQARSHSVSVVSSAAQGLVLLAEKNFEFAFVDVQLCDGYCFPLTSALLKRRIPFALCTGFVGATFDPEYDGVPVLLKPYDEATLSAVLDIFVRDNPTVTPVASRRSVRCQL